MKKTKLFIGVVVLLLVATNTRAARVSVINPGFDFTTVEGVNTPYGWSSGLGSHVPFEMLSGGYVDGGATILGWGTERYDGGSSTSGGVNLLPSNFWMVNNYPGSENSTGEARLGAALVQILPGALQPNTTYTLSATVYGRTAPMPSTQNVVAELRDGSNTELGGNLVYVAPTTVGPGSVTYTVTTGGAAAGDLKIVLANAETVSWTAVDYDDVELLTGPLAENPSPHDPTYVNPVARSTNFTWDAPSGTTVSGYDIYIDPNLAKVDSANASCLYAVIGTTATTFNPPADLAYNTVYYWRVDVREPNVPGPDTIYPGRIWTFKTVPQSPVITGQPADQLVFNGESAVFTVIANDPLGDTLSYQWYKYVDGSNDTPVGINSNVLTVGAHLSASDEGDYYCAISNASPNPTVSDLANLTLKDLAGRWKFDGDPNDSTAYGNHGTVISNPQYIAGVNGTGQALLFDGSDDFVSLPANVFEHVTKDGLSVSLWIYGAASQPAADMAFSAYKGNQLVALAHLPWEDSTVYWDSGNGEGGVDFISKLAQSSEYKGQWNHWVFTRDVQAGEMKIYHNGVLWHEGSGTVPIGTPTQIYVGSGNSGSSFNYAGAIDDFRIYNYALDPYEVAGLYVEVFPDAEICVERPESDISGPTGDPDCVVDLYDFAAMAEFWLDSGIVTGV